VPGSGAVRALEGGFIRKSRHGSLSPGLLARPLPICYRRTSPSSRRGAGPRFFLAARPGPGARLSVPGAGPGAGQAWAVSVARPAGFFRGRALYDRQQEKHMNFSCINCLSLTRPYKALQNQKPPYRKTCPGLAGRGPAGSKRKKPPQKIRHYPDRTVPTASRKSFFRGAPCWHARNNPPSPPGLLLSHPPTGLGPLS
jgi:hypothetical protein